MQVEAWSRNYFFHDQRIVGTSWAPPFAAAQVTGGLEKSSYTLDIDWER